MTDPFPEQGERVYELGDKVLYPHHGAGEIVRKEVKEVLGQRREYLTIQILHNDLMVMVPTEHAHRAGLRPVIGEEIVDEVIAVLRGAGTHTPKSWHRRFKHNREKIRTGDVFELAEVLRNLLIRELDTGLSTLERQMFGRAKKILASELMYARHVDQQEATELLENLLEEIGQRRASRSAMSVIHEEEALVD
jgi:CarD family transcriptional regulator